jgi:hypothetical protein
MLEGGKPAYTAQDVLLLIGPTFIFFTVTLCHTSYLQAISAEKFAWVPVRLQRPVYLAANVIAFVFQFIGSAMLGTASTRHAASTDTLLMITGYAIQLAFGVFLMAENITVTLRTSKAIKKARSEEPREPLRGSRGVAQVSHIKQRFPHFQRWNQLFGLAIGIIPIGRNMMRMTEFGVSMLSERELFSYLFDGWQMVLVMAMFGLFYLPGKLKDVLGVQELQAEGWLEPSWTEMTTTRPDTGTPKVSEVASSSREMV